MYQNYFRSIHKAAFVLYSVYIKSVNFVETLNKFNNPEQHKDCTYMISETWYTEHEC